MRADASAPTLAETRRSSAQRRRRAAPAATSAAHRPRRTTKLPRKLLKQQGAFAQSTAHKKAAAKQSHAARSKTTTDGDNANVSVMNVLERWRLSREARCANIVAVCSSHASIEWHRGDKATLCVVRVLEYATC